jgi:hypothetical protein
VDQKTIYKSLKPLKYYMAVSSDYNRIKLENNKERYEKSPNT